MHTYTHIAHQPTPNRPTLDYSTFPSILKDALTPSLARFPDHCFAPSAQTLPHAPSPVLACPPTNDQAGGDETRPA
jgi:hypothetical protein